jgi:glycine cleavage system H lipoate-binding protein
MPQTSGNQALTRSPLRSPQVNSSPFEDAWMMKVKLSNPAGAQPERLLHALGSRCGLSFRR